MEKVIQKTHYQKDDNKKHQDMLEKARLFAS